MSQQIESVRSTSEESPRGRLLRTIGALAATLDPSANRLSSGERSSLRRDMSGFSPAFYKLAADILATELQQFKGESALTVAEKRWSVVVRCMAKLGGQHRPGGMKFGAALAQATLSEMRFVRLLRADAKQLEALIDTTLAPLVQGGLVFDQADLVALVLSADGEGVRLSFEDNENVRRRVARDFYGFQENANQKEGASK